MKATTRIRGVTFHRLHFVGSLKYGTLLNLLDIYAKNQKADLSGADKRGLKRLLPILVSQYLKRKTDMPKPARKQATAKHTAAGQRLIRRVN